jgi:hypothetical protein
VKNPKADKHIHKFTMLNQDKSVVIEDREVHSHIIRVTKEVTKVKLRCKDCEEDKEQENVRFIGFMIGKTELKPTGAELKLVRCTGGCKQCEKVETD